MSGAWLQDWFNGILLLLYGNLGKPDGLNVVNRKFLVGMSYAFSQALQPYAWVHELYCCIFSGKRSRPRGPAFRPHAVSSTAFG